MIGTVFAVIVLLAGADTEEKPWAEPAKLGRAICVEQDLAVARGGQDVFLDPTEERRSAVLARLDKETRVPLMNAKQNASKPSTKLWAHMCEGSVQREMWKIERWSSPFGSSDPRRWDPVEVARYVLEARKYDALAAAAPRLPYGMQEECPDESPCKKFEIAMSHLERMGVERASKLVRPVSLSGTRAAGLIRGYREHFPLEYDLYRREWDISNPDLDSWELGEGPPQAKFVEDRGKYVGERWLEMDRAAPHPDMAAVEAAIKRLEAERSLP